MKGFDSDQPDILTFYKFNITAVIIRAVTLSVIEVSDDKDNK
ncbi:hypothetical protein ACFO4P_02490 [Epilithonimonas pallida]|jgi:hypothetical protein|uniref:Uncharacterized protein n=1 Tax=Epilithonimonas pallida TaxID=373671 RepID=A0ABY1R0Z7_9FLAO|nr:hypothetical protein SAMN05421679_103123 [Epilithonimonas pallida]